MHDLSKHPYAKQFCETIAVFLGEKKSRLGIRQDPNLTARFQRLKALFDDKQVSPLDLIKECRAFVNDCLSMVYYAPTDYFGPRERQMLIENLYDSLEGIHLIEHAAAKAKRP